MHVYVASVRVCGYTQVCVVCVYMCGWYMLGEAGVQICGVCRSVWVHTCVLVFLCICGYTPTFPQAYLNHKATRLDPVLGDTKHEISVYCVPSGGMWDLREQGGRWL